MYRILFLKAIALQACFPVSSCLSGQSRQCRKKPVSALVYFGQDRRIIGNLR